MKALLGVVGLVVFAGAGGLACSGGKRMGERHVTLVVAGRSVRLTEQDGERMRVALVGALARSPDAALQAEGGRLGNGGAGVGPDDDLRIGAWLVDVRGEELVLVWRQEASPGGLLNRVARLSGTPGGAWTVTGIDEEIVHRR
jgi:hypothetical protein